MVFDLSRVLLTDINSSGIMMYIFRVIEKLMVIYFLIYFSIDIILFVYSLILHKKINSEKTDDKAYEGYSVSIIVPAYNEEVSIVSCIKMLINVDYSDFEIIIINDGSKDSTLNALLSSFSFIESDKHSADTIKTGKVRKVYKDVGNKLILIDKENGGKADSVNAGINYSTKNHICTIDADSILDEQALKMVIKPMLGKNNIIVAGGFLAVSNNLIISNGKIINKKMPRNIWVLWQIVEYIKSFMIARLSLSRMNMLMIMSGAFSVYKKADLSDVGGLLTEFNDHPYILNATGGKSKTVCEDMEIVIRLSRFYREKKIKGKVAFLPHPVCWTEVPDNYKSLYKQRSRWHQGLGESLRLHRKIIFEPFYGVMGLLALPYYFLFEFLSPFVKLFSLFFLVTLSIVNVINAKWMLLLLLSALLITTIIISVITVVLETKSKNGLAINRKTLRYNTFGDWILLLITSIFGSFIYEFFKMFAQLRGALNILQKKNEWNKFDRKGIQTFENL
jgi:poly-beta-1,6-N-acetyl-D-glucosamine synthase